MLGNMSAPSPSASAASSSASATITAVDGLDLDVPEGTCVGLLGPNGAGKSTTMKMLTAQAIADEGEIEVLGFELPGDSKQARAQMRRRAAARQPRRRADLRARTSPCSRGCTACRAPSARPPSTARWRSRTSAERADTRVDKLSGGMRRRLLIARALVHRPRLLLLDEPTVGLDPQVRQELWALIDALRSEGTSILMSTHYIEEAERLADTVAIMSRGPRRRRGRAGRARARARRAPRRSRSTARRRGSPRSQASASGRGCRVRRTGTAVAILRAEAANGDAARGRAARRPRSRTCSCC